MTIPPPPPIPPAAPAAPAAPAKGASWWRRNRLALLVLALLLPTTALTVGWQEWRQYFDFGARPVTPIIVDDGGTAVLAGADWGPVRGGEVDDVAGLDVPADSRLIAVAVPVDPRSEGMSCDAPRLVEQATGREWQPMRTEIGLPFDATEPETCLAEHSSPYELVVPFVVPEDAEGPFWVDVRPYDAAGSFLRFSFAL